MNTVAMLALEFVGIAVAVILIALRLILLLRQPYHTKLEILGAASMILGCLVSIYFMATFCQQGIQILHWFSQGYSETEIRAKLSVPRYLKMVFSADLTTVTALWLPKVSMLAAYAPAYRGFHQKLKILFRVTIAVTALTYLGSMVVFIFYCFPVSMNWNVSPPDGKPLCITALILTPILVTCIFNIAADLLVLAVPIFALLQIPGHTRTQRYGVATIIGLGLISIAVSLYRALGADLGGYTTGKPLPLAKRNIHIVGNTFMVVPILIAFSLPDLRVTLRVFLKGNRKRDSTHSSTMLSNYRGAQAQATENRQSFVKLVEPDLKGDALATEERTKLHI